MIPPEFFQRLAEIESRSNPMARNPRSTAKGKYQFVDKTAAQYGITDPFSESQQDAAIQKFTQDNYNVLRRNLGRDPTMGELYLAHQQGATGATRLLTNPASRAVDVRNQKAILLNAGRPDMTARDFSNKWISKFEEGMPQSATFSGTHQLPEVQNAFEDGLPEGFTLDNDDSELPEGFVIDEAPLVEAEFAPQTSPQVPQQKGFFGRVGDDINKRAIMAGEIEQDMRSGAVGPIHGRLQLAGKAGFGLANDIIGEAITSTAKGFGKLPVAGRDPRNMGQFASDQMARIPQPVKDTIGGAVAYAGGKYGQFKEAHPIIARDIESVGNAATFMTPVKGKTLGNALGEGAYQVGKYPVKTVAGGVADTAKGAFARGDDALDLAINAQKTVGSDLYKGMRQAGAVVNSNRAQRLVNDVRQAVLSSGKMNADLHKNTLSVLRDMEEAAAKGDLGLEELDQFRQLLGDAVKTGKGDADAFKASRAIDALDDSIDTLKAADLVNGSIDAVTMLKAARKQWAKTKKMEKVADIIKQSGGDPNRIKAGFKRYYLKKENRRGWSKEEWNQIRIAGSNSFSEKILKGFGKLGFDLGTDLTPGNTFMPVLGLGAASLGAGTAPLVAAGTVARQGQKWVARGKAENVLKTIEKQK